MRIEKLLLVGVLIDRIPIGKRAVDYSASHYGENRVEGDLLTYVGEFPVSSRSLTQLNGQIPDFWKDKVRSAFVTDAYHHFNDYIVFYSVIDLDPAALNDLLGDNPYEIGKGIDALYETLYAKLGCYTDFSGSFKYPNLLCVLPELDESFNTGDYFDSAAKIAREFRTTLNDQSVLIPHLLFDTLLFPPISPVGPESGMVVVDLSRRPEAEAKPHTFQLTKTVFDLALYMAGFRIVADSNDRLKKLPFVSESIALYVSRIRQDKKTTSPIKNRSEREMAGQPGVSVSAAYEFRFLNDRIESSLERDNVNQSVAAVHERLINNTLSQSNKGGISRSLVSVMGTKPEIRISLMASLTDAFESACKKLETTEKLLRSREAELSDYLRDLAVADATRTNLNLQRNVRLLTRVAIAFAFLSLLFTFLTDDNKEKIVTGVAGWLREFVRLIRSAF